MPGELARIELHLARRSLEPLVRVLPVRPFELDEMPLDELVQRIRRVLKPPGAELLGRVPREERSVDVPLRQHALTEIDEDLYVVLGLPERGNDRLPNREQ